jgi:hypothetical protein
VERNTAKEYYGTSLIRFSIVAWKAWARLEGRPT